MRFSADWRNDGENAAPEERATVADLSLFLDGINVTQHLIEGASRDRVTVSLYGLAHGIAHDWWTIFGSRNEGMSLLKYRSGYLLPDVRIRFDGASFDIEARQQFYRDPDVRFWGGAAETLSREAGEAALDDLVTTILDRLDDAGERQSGAWLRWQRVQASRASAEAGFCEAAGGLGLDPYTITDEAAEFIEGAERLFERETLVEFVSGAAGVRHADLLLWAERMQRQRDDTYRVPGLRPAVDEIGRADPARSGEAAWAVGYRRAGAMRRVLGLGQAHRFDAFQDLARRLDASSHFAPAPGVDGIRALRGEGEDGMRIYLRDHGRSAGAPAGHLFTLARAVGDAACFPETSLAPINDLHNAFRQAAGRAFAAEFLAPIAEIRSMLDDRHDLVTIADEFSVSMAVVTRQIENETRIARAVA